MLSHAALTMGCLSVDADREAEFAELAQLTREEQELSVRRRRLHDRLDFLRGSGEGGQGVARLVEEEGHLSARRRELHVRIDELRVVFGLEPGPPPKERLLD